MLCNMKHLGIRCDLNVIVCGELLPYHCIGHQRCGQLPDNCRFTLLPCHSIGHHNFSLCSFSLCRLRPVNMHTSVNGVGCANDPFEDLFAMVNFIFGFKTVEKLCNSNKF